MVDENPGTILHIRDEDVFCSCRKPLLIGSLSFSQSTPSDPPSPQSKDKTLLNPVKLHESGSEIDRALGGRAVYFGIVSPAINRSGGKFSRVIIRITSVCSWPKYTA